LGDIAATVPHLVVGQGANATDCEQLLAREAIDCLLLDIQMPGRDGLQMAQWIKGHAGAGRPMPAVIFVSAFEHHALQAFDLAVVDYLVKPVRASRLQEALLRVPRHPEDRSESAGITVTERGRIVRVALADILYLKAELKYVTIRTAAREFLTESTLTALEARFPDVFLRIHRNALVNKTALVGIERSHLVSPEGDPEGQWQVLLRGVDERLDISRRQLAQVKALLRHDG
jgi:two-component system response regulator AlgR